MFADIPDTVVSKASSTLTSKHVGHLLSFQPSDISSDLLLFTLFIVFTICTITPKSHLSPSLFIKQ